MLVDILSVLAPVLTSIAGGLVGYLSARAMWRAQEKQRRQNIAVGFLIELISMEKMLTGWSNSLSQPDRVRIDTPLYPATGLFHVLQRELFSFDPALSRSLFEFYSHILEAERLRTYAPEDPRYPILQQGAGAGLKAAVGQLSHLQQLLGREAGNQMALPATSRRGA